MPDAHDIDGVVSELDRIIAAAIAEGSRIGLFAALYRQVTLRVRQGIASGFFEDGPRMAMLDTVFANRYLSALATWQAGGAPSKSWKCAFAASRRADLILLQHLLLGINAHINLDLGVAAATICPGTTLAPLHTDFDRINQILASLTDEVKRVVGEFSPMLHLLEKIPGDVEDAMVNFSMTIARDDAWHHAELLAAQEPPQQGPTIALIDAKTAFLARLIVEPGRILSTVLEAVHLGESRNIPEVIAALNAIVTT
ncbi:MAG TPA: DUF5995 family protein [Kofleriaceae bacterium]|nr:DUF5995 family protein [Kofleriaceae bacterium]